MHHADKTITIYHKTWDAEKGADVYKGTIIPNVSFFAKVSTTVTTDGLVAASEGALRIPMEVYPDGLELRNGDILCEGSLQTNDVRPGDLNALCPYVYTVVGITRNTSGREPHVKVVCK